MRINPLHLENPMIIEFAPMCEEHGPEIMEIFNHYIANSFAAYPDTTLPPQAFALFLQMTKGYPAFAIMDGSRLIGFCFLRAYNPMPAFSATAEITSFIHPEFTGMGIGRSALAKIEEAARGAGIRRILASISSLNAGSIRFHAVNGFLECGRFHGIGVKKGNVFDVVWMEKEIS